MKRRVISFSFSLFVCLSFFTASVLVPFIGKLLGCDLALLKFVTLGLTISVIFLSVFYCYGEGYLNSIANFSASSFQLQKEITSTIKYFIFAIVVTWFASILIGLLYQKIGIQIQMQKAVELMKDKSFVKQPMDYLMHFLLIAILAPIYEEFVFRGIFQTAWVQRFGSSFGQFLASLVFAFAHLHEASWEAFRPIIPLFIFALFLAHAYEKRQNLFAPALLHIFLNTTTLLSLRFVS